MEMAMVHNRRSLLSAVLGVLASGSGRSEEKRMEKLWVFVGTSTQNGKSKGIYRFQWDPESGEATDPVPAADTPNPTFLAIHPDRRHLYCVNAVADFGEGKTGAISAFALDPKSGDLRFLNKKSSGGPGPCHVITDRTGKHVLTANYTGGSAAVLPIEADGRVGDPTSVVQHHGSSVNASRQEGPHAHSINLSPDGRFAFVADLGLDQVLVYRFDSQAGTLTPHDPPFARTAAGAGPRHFAFQPSGRFAYVINELDSTVTAFAYDAAAGRLTEIQAITTLPAGFSGENYPAEILVHPSGRFLYGSNRGHDSLAIFRIDGETGKLTPAGHQSTGGKGPRNFNFDPSGRWVVVGNQGTNNVLFFRLDPETGALTRAGRELQCPAPICFRFLAPA
jgi:6-phosphogluconolactonase